MFTFSMFRFVLYHTGESVKGKGQPAAFALKHYGYKSSEDVPKRVREFLKRCLELVSTHPSIERVGHGSWRVCGRTMRTSWDKRRRRHGLQGRPIYCPELQRHLFQWFLMIRKSIKGRLWSKHVKAAAEVIKKRIIKWYADQALPAPAMPKINRRWLQRFRLTHGISFRHPNRRYKVSRKKIKNGLKVTWLNYWCARLLFQLLYGARRKAKGLGQTPVTNHVDQKPVHFNEGDSKNLQTLEVSGAVDVPLKTNHSDSRTRLTANTMVTHPAPTAQPGEAYQPPIEVLFKLKTDRVLRGLVIPNGVVMTVAHSASGSYNLDSFLSYLDRHLQPLTPEREADFDYRVLALDAFEVHKTEQVRDFAMDRGYLLIYHRGGTTSIGQWNDTDLHLQLERHYNDLENFDFSKQLAVRLWKCPTRTRQAIVNDLASIWAALPHAAIGEKAGLRTAWSIALPRQLSDGSFEIHGPEDHLVSREAKTFFFENDMPGLRAKHLGFAYRAYMDGRISCWRDVAALMLPFDTDDVEKEGQELLDGGDGDDDNPWNDDDSDEDDDPHGPSSRKRKLGEAKKPEAAPHSVVVTSSCSGAVVAAPPTPLSGDAEAACASKQEHIQCFSYIETSFAETNTFNFKRFCSLSMIA